MRVLYALTLYEASWSYGLPPDVILTVMANRQPLRRERQGAFRVPVWSVEAREAGLSPERLRDLKLDGATRQPPAGRWAAEAA